MLDTVMTVVFVVLEIIGIIGWAYEIRNQTDEDKKRMIFRYLY